MLDDNCTKIVWEYLNDNFGPPICYFGCDITAFEINNYRIEVLEKHVDISDVLNSRDLILTYEDPKLGEFLDELNQTVPSKHESES